MRGVIGRPRFRPDTLVADRGYDHDKHRRLVRARGIKPVIARRTTEHGSGLGRVRWVVERTFAWLHHLKRLLVRYEPYVKRWTNARAVSATSRQPLSIVNACPRPGISAISVTPSFRFWRL